ncbi:hypothetical protein COTS27_00680 [Spirochaetota bacterium]|nr:hypothetical protein COTS27_00680 [Spirochaetota bacterium]
MTNIDLLMIDKKEEKCSLRALIGKSLGRVLLFIIVLGSLLLGMSGCAAKQGILTISEVKAFAIKRDLQTTIPVFITAITDGNRDVQYASLNQLGQNYLTLIENVYNVTEENKEAKKYTNALPIWQSALIEVEEFLTNFYDMDTIDFNHRALIIRALSYGLHTRETSIAFFKKILSEENEIASLSTAEQRELWVFTLNTLSQQLNTTGAVATTSADDEEVLAYKTLIEKDFLAICENELLAASDEVFRAALLGMIAYAKWSGETTFVLERLARVQTDLLALQPASVKNSDDATTSAPANNVKKPTKSPHSIPVRIFLLETAAAYVNK